MLPRPQKAGEHKGKLEKTQDTKMLEAHQAGREMYQKGCDRAL